MSSTAKDGLFRKQSVAFSDISQGMRNRRHVAKLMYNDALDSKARLGLHDAITIHLDSAGTAGESLLEALKKLFAGLEAEGIGAGAFFDEAGNAIEIV